MWAPPNILPGFVSPVWLFLFVWWPFQRAKNVIFIWKAPNSGLPWLLFSFLSSRGLALSCAALGVYFTCSHTGLFPAAPNKKATNKVWRQLSKNTLTYLTVFRTQNSTHPHLSYVVCRCCIRIDQGCFPFGWVLSDDHFKHFNASLLATLFFFIWASIAQGFPNATMTRSPIHGSCHTIVLCNPFHNYSLCLCIRTLFRYNITWIVVIFSNIFECSY